MRTTITVTYNSRGINRLTKDIRELRGELKKIDGKYVFFVDAFQPGKAAASKPMIIDEGLLSRAVEPSLRLNPSALSPNIAGGRLLPDKKRAMIGALQREQTRQRTMGGRRLIRTRAGTSNTMQTSLTISAAISAKLSTEPSAASEGGNKGRVQFISLFPPVIGWVLQLTHPTIHRR